MAVQPNFVPKIALLGSGMIGGTLALLAALKKLSNNIVLLDILEDMPKGKALDLAQAMTAEGVTATLTGESDPDFKGLQDADIVIVTAGVPRKPGMSREDLIGINTKIVTNAGLCIKRRCPNAFVVCITNPLDAMVNLLQKVSGLPTNMVVGMAGILDTSRFRHFLGEKLGVSPRDVQALVLGGHGDQMIPLRSVTTAAGIHIDTWIKMGKITEEEYQKIVERTQNGGGEIVALLKMGSAFVAPASSALTMVESYLRDEKRILPCCAYVNSGTYRLKESCYAGVPVVIGRKGVEQVIEVPLTSQEQCGLDESMSKVYEMNKETSRAYDALAPEQRAEKN